MTDATTQPNAVTGALRDELAMRLEGLNRELDGLWKELAAAEAELKVSAAQKRYDRALDRWYRAQKIHEGMKHALEAK